MGRFSGLSEENTFTAGREGVSETGPNFGEDQQMAGGEILPVEDGPLPHWPVLQGDEEQAHSQVLVVPVPGSDPGVPFQELPPLESPENPVGGTVVGDGKRE